MHSTEESVRSRVGRGAQAIAPFVAAFFGGMVFISVVSPRIIETVEIPSADPPRFIVSEQARSPAVWFGKFHCESVKSDDPVALSGADRYSLTGIRVAEINRDVFLSNCRVVKLISSQTWFTTSPLTPNWNSSSGTTIPYSSSSGYGALK